MLSPKDFRRIVLGLRDAVESSHMGHPDFRVNGRIFASLNGDETRGMVVLTPEDAATLALQHSIRKGAVRARAKKTKAPPRRRGHASR